MPNTEQSIEETGGVPVVEMEMEVSGMTQTAVDPTLTIQDMAADAKATGDAIRGVADDLADLATDVSNIEKWSGEDIPLNGEDGAPTIAEAIANVFENLYPVGSLYISASAILPDEIGAIGTWVEVAIPITWGDMKNGTRSYIETETGFEPGNLHFWLRTA